jgi:hypothetical protein
MRTVSANLNFFDCHVEASKYHWTPGNEHRRPINDRTPDTHEVRIFDMRSLTVEQRTEMGLTLEKAGFETLQGWGDGGEYVAKAWAEKQWKDERWIETEYYEFVKKSLSSAFLSLRHPVLTCIVSAGSWPGSSTPLGSPSTTTPSVNDLSPQRKPKTGT